MKHFSIKELCASDIAEKRNIDNTPNNEQRANLQTLIQEVLDPAREKLGCPVIVTSGFRSSTLNFAVGGAKLSQHQKGQAADLVVADPEGRKTNADLFRILKEQNKFDQLIWEQGDFVNPQWVHVSHATPKENRHQVLMITKENGKNVTRKFNNPKPEIV